MPPKSFNPRKDNYVKLNFHIPNPIEQAVQGKNGIFNLALYTKAGRSFDQYKSYCMKAEKQIEGKSQQEIESIFWSTIQESVPLYGSDCPGTIFDPGCSWNLNEIDSPLKEGLNYEDMKGITSPYLYFGCWKSIFCFHKEDMDLHSINYVHFGRPKHWYGIPVSCKDKFEKLLMKLYPLAFKNCTQFHRHKTLLVHPSILIKNGIEIYKCIQEEGQFVITQGGAFHSGFNYGINCAEAVNFCTSNWLYVGKSAKVCHCQVDSLELNLPLFMSNLNKNATEDNKSLVKTYNKVAKKLKINTSIKSYSITNWVQCDNKSCRTWFDSYSKHFILNRSIP